MINALVEEALNVRRSLVYLEGCLILVQLVEDSDVWLVQLGMCQVDERSRLVGAHGCQRLRRQRVKGLSVTFQQLEPDDQAEAIPQLHAVVTLQVAILLRVAVLPSSDGAPAPWLRRASSPFGRPSERFGRSFSAALDSAGENLPYWIKLADWSVGSL